MRKHHINTIKSVAADNVGVNYRSIWGFHVIDSEELEDGPNCCFHSFNASSEIIRFYEFFKKKRRVKTVKSMKSMKRSSE